MAVVIGIGNADPSKITTVRRQMRTHDERTSGAWTCGCETIPMAARKKPHCRQQVQLPQRILKGAYGTVTLQSLGEPVPCQTQEA